MRSYLNILAGISTVQAYTVINHEQFMTKNVDALVVPGTYKSHMHSFFGSDVITNVQPTSADLQKGCYTGDNANDLSVYWIPTLYYVDDDNHTEVKPMRFSTYYHIENAEIPFPQDFAAIAGNAKGVSQADVDDGKNDMSWWCEDGPEDAGKDGGKFPRKTCNTHLQVILRFPDCVDTNNLTDYTYNDAGFKTENRCPEGMSRIPQLRFSVRYDLRKIIPGGWEGTAPLQLACGEVGDGYCFHGDFINGWFPDAAENMLKVAAHKRNFARVDGEHGTEPLEPTCEATDADPENGTSDYQTSLQMMAETSTARRSVRRSLLEKRTI